MPDLHAPRRASWILRLFLLVLGGNIGLLLLGLLVVPRDLGSAQGLAVLLATMGLQGGLAVLALVGPVAFHHFPRTMGISLALGGLFAMAYLGILACEIAGIQLSFDTGSGTIYALFVGAAFIAGALASLRTQRLRDGVVASAWALVTGTAIWSLGMLLLNYSLWGSPHWYQFWQGDGALNDFRQSGSTDLAVFLLQDMQGALFFHPILSAVIGTVGGFIGGSLILGPLVLWRRLRRFAVTRA